MKPPKGPPALSASACNAGRRLAPGSWLSGIAGLIASVNDQPLSFAARKQTHEVAG